MATPAPAWNLIRVYGTWNNMNGTRKAGSYKVTIPQRVTDVTDDVIIPAGVFTTGSLNTGAGQVSLDAMIPAVDDADISPRNFVVIVDVMFNDGSAAEQFNIRPTIVGGAINLRSITPGPNPDDQLDTDPPLTDAQVLANAAAYTDDQIEGHEAAANPHPIYLRFVDAAGNPLTDREVIIAGAGEPFPAVVPGGVLFYGGT